MNVLHKFKKFTALTLACLTALTSIPLTSFAATGVGGNASGSSTGGVVIGPKQKLTIHKK